jgi:hypothetical protein
MKCAKLNTFFDFLTLEDGTGRLSRNVGKELPLDAAQHPRIVQISTLMLTVVASRLLYGPGVDSASNRNEYQEYFLGCKGDRYVGLITLPPSCADCLEIWEPQPPGNLRACPGLVMGLLYLLPCSSFYRLCQIIVVLC